MKLVFSSFILLFSQIVLAQNVSIYTERKCVTKSPYLTEFRFIDDNGKDSSNPMFTYSAKWKVTCIFDKIYTTAGTHGAIDLKKCGLHEVEITAIKNDTGVYKTYKTFSIDSFIYKKLSPPIIVSAYNQCFKNNLITISDTTHANSWGISEYVVVPDDGQIFSFYNPKFPLRYSFSYKDRRGGKLQVIISAGFCISDTIYPAIIHPDIAPRFTVSLQDSTTQLYGFFTSTSISTPAGALGGYKLYFPEGTKLFWTFMDGTTKYTRGNSNDAEAREQFSREMTRNPINTFPMLKVTDTAGCSDSFRLFVKTNKSYTISDTNQMCSIEGYIGDSTLQCQNNFGYFEDLVVSARNQSGELLGFDNLGYNQKYKIFTDFAGGPIYVYVNKLNYMSNPVYVKSLKYDSAKQAIKNFNFNTGTKTIYNNDLKISVGLIRHGRESNLNLAFINHKNKVLKNAKILLQTGAGVFIDTLQFGCHTAGKNSFVFTLGDLQPCTVWKKNLKLKYSPPSLEYVNFKCPFTATIVYDSLKQDSSSKLEFSYKNIGNKLILSLKNTGNKDMTTYGTFWGDNRYTFKLKAGDSTLFKGLFAPGASKVYFIEYDTFNTRYSGMYLPIKYGNDGVFLIESCQVPSENSQSDFCYLLSEIKYSYDPNEKNVELLPKSNQRNAPFPLHYTIHFQNTGTDTAEKIIVRDPLFGPYNMASFHITKSSHPCSFKFINGIAEFTFKNINLVDSGTNFNESQGFIEYNINSNAEGVENYADIYFDLNKPVRTNTTVFKLPVQSYPPQFTKCRNFGKINGGRDAVTCNATLVDLPDNANYGFWTQKWNKPLFEESDTIIYTWHLLECADTLTDDVQIIRAKFNRQAPDIAPKGIDSLSCTQLAATYIWYIDGNKLPMNSKTIKPFFRGKYSVQLSNDTCTGPVSSSFYWTRDPFTKTNDLLKAQLKIYPNPTRNILNIEGISTELKYFVYDMSGKLIMTGIIGPSTPFIQTDMMNSGLYMLFLESKNGNQMSTLFVKE